MAQQRTAEDFFRLLYEGVGAGFIEIRPLLDDEDPRKNSEEGRKAQARMRKFFPWPSEVGRAVKYAQAVNADYHIYYGVALRKDDSGGGKKNIGAATAVFADVDFKDVDPETVRKLLGQFPLKPSIVVKSGHGLHVYWLLKEPAYESAFPRLEGINRGMLKYLRAQVGPQDISRILRVPGSRNIKKKYPDPKPLVEISWWHPEYRYLLDDFEGYLPHEDIQPTKTYALQGRPGDAHPQGAPPILEPSFELEDEVLDECAGLLAKTWISGYRHMIALHVAGWFAHVGYSEASAEKLMTHICAAAGDEDVADRLTSVRHSYEKYRAGERVAGFAALEKLAKDSLPEILHEQLSKVLTMVRRSVPKRKTPARAPQAPAAAPPAGSTPPPHASSGPETPPGAPADYGRSGRGRGWRKGEGTSDRDPGFEIVKYIKFTSNPPQYTVVINREGHEYLVTCEGEGLVRYRIFMASAFMQTEVALPKISEEKWAAMLNAAKKEFREAPVEATRTGALAKAIEEFVQEARENPDPGLLKTFCGYDDTHYFFVFGAWRTYVADTTKLKVEDAVLYDYLRLMGWTSTIRRFGKRVCRVWVRSVSIPPSDPPPAPPDSPEPAPLPPSTPTEGTAEIPSFPGNGSHDQVVTPENDTSPGLEGTYDLENSQNNDPVGA